MDCRNWDGNEVLGAPMVLVLAPAALTVAGSVFSNFKINCVIFFVSCGLFIPGLSKCVLHYFGNKHAPRPVFGIGNGAILIVEKKQWRI